MAILAGGLGTRLSTVSPACPKTIAMVAGKPFLVHLLEWLRKQDVHDVVLCVGYRWQDIRGILGNGLSLDMRLTYSIENVPLGTAGAIKKAQPFLDGTFLVLNGDTYVDADLNALSDFHHQKGALATLALVHADDKSRYGTVYLDKEGRIKVFYEKQWGGAGGWISAGLYVFEPMIFSYIPDGRPVSLELEVFPRLVAEQNLIYGFPIRSYFVDIGTPEAYLRCQKELKGRI